MPVGARQADQTVGQRGMFGAERLFAYLKDAPVQWFGQRISSLLLIERGQVIQLYSQVRMRRSPAGLPDCQATQVQRLSFAQFALMLVEHRQVVERARQVDRFLPI